MMYLRRVGQFIVIAGLFWGVAAFANWPAYRQIPRGSAVVLLAFVHGADRNAGCRRLSAKEIEKLPPNMRRVRDCPRGRPSIYVELDIGGRAVFHKNLPPTGLAGDGHSRVYQRFVMPAGKYDIAVRMRDTPRVDGFDHEGKKAIALVPNQMFVIDFNSDRGEFIFH